MTNETSRPLTAIRQPPVVAADIAIAQLHLAAAGARREVEQILRPENLGWYDFLVLRLVRKGRTRFYQVAAEAGMVKATLRTVVYGLTVRDLIVRSEERSRVVVLELTPGGSSLTDRLLRSVRAREERMLSVLTSAQRGVFSESLCALAEYLLNPSVEVADRSSGAGPPLPRPVVDATAPRHPATDVVVGRYQGGQAMRQIADAVGLSYGKVRGILIAAGVQLRPKGGARPGGQSAGTPQRPGRAAPSARRQRATAEVISRYRAGESMHRIAAEVCLSYNTVRSILIDAGIALRSSGGSTAARGGGSTAGR